MVTVYIHLYTINSYYFEVWWRMFSKALEYATVNSENKLKASSP